MDIQPELFEHDHRRPWPDPSSFPINEKTSDLAVEPVLLKDINSTTDLLIITGFTSISHLVEVLGSKDFPLLKHTRVVIGFEIDQRTRKQTSYYALPAEIKNYWLKQDVSIRLCSAQINLIQKIKEGSICFKVFDKLHAKIYITDNAAILGSSNFSANGLKKQREANIRVQALRKEDETDSPGHVGRKLERGQYASMKLIAENYYEMAEEYNQGMLDLLQSLLKDATWQEALARALCEVLESKWMKDFPQLFSAIRNQPLWPSQHIGLAKAMKIIQDQGNVLIADPTGSGKTKLGTTLLYTIFHWMWENGAKDHSNALIISPAQAMESWEGEKLSYNIKNGIESMGVLSNAKKAKLERLQKEIESSDILLIDEAHNYLNWGSQRSKRLRPKRSAHIVLATATPINRRAEDLLRLIELLDIDNLSDVDLDTYYQLRKSGGTKKDEKALNKLREYIKLFIVRRTKRDMNAAVDREPDFFRNEKGNLCRYPKNISRIYQTGESDSDRQVAEEINKLVLGLKGINYLQDLRCPKYLKTDKDKQDYYLARFRSAPALAGYRIKSSMRSSAPALYERIYGTEAAATKYGIEPHKVPTGNVLAKLHSISAKRPDIPESVIKFLSTEAAWILTDESYQAACNHEISTYKSIGKCAGQLSRRREEAKAKLLLELAEKHDKVLGFDSTVITLHYLHSIIKKWHATVPIIVATGQDESSKKQVRDSFHGRYTADGHKVIALCSDAMSESINLTAAKALVLLDLPSVLRLIEQRIGRLERMDSEHKEIFVRWPNDTGPFSLKSDARLFEILQTTEKLIGGNVIPPDDGIYEHVPQLGLDADGMIAAYEAYDETDGAWEGINDNTTALLNMMRKKGGLIQQRDYDQFKDVDAEVKSAISFVESGSAWSFFAFRGSPKRSPAWLLIDEERKPYTDYFTICAKLEDYLKRPGLIQRKWEEVDTSAQFPRITQLLRKYETELMPHKKRRALAVGKKLLLAYAGKAGGGPAVNEGVDALNQLLRWHDERLSADEDIDRYHLADLWLTILLPALDRKRYAHTRRRRPYGLRDLTPSDVLLTPKQLVWLAENAERGTPLDALVAACIISVKPEDI